MKLVKEWRRRKRQLRIAFKNRPAGCRAPSADRPRMTHLARFGRSADAPQFVSRHARTLFEAFVNRLVLAMSDSETMATSHRSSCPIDARPPSRRLERPTAEPVILLDRSGIEGRAERQDAAGGQQAIRGRPRLGLNAEGLEAARDGSGIRLTPRIHSGGVSTQGLLPAFWQLGERARCVGSMTGDARFRSASPSPDTGASAGTRSGALAPNVGHLRNRSSAAALTEAEETVASVRAKTCGFPKKSRRMSGRWAAFPPHAPQFAKSREEGPLGRGESDG